MHREIKENLDATNVSTPNSALEHQRRKGLREGTIRLASRRLFEADLAEPPQFAELAVMKQIALAWNRVQFSHLLSDTRRTLELRRSRRCQGRSTTRSRDDPITAA